MLSFESAAACKLVAEHVEDHREGLLAARTVGLVEVLRRVAALGNDGAAADGGGSSSNATTADALRSNGGLAAVGNGIV